MWASALLSAMQLRRMTDGDLTKSTMYRGEQAERDVSSWIGRLNCWTWQQVEPLKSEIDWEEEPESS